MKKSLKILFTGLLCFILQDISAQYEDGLSILMKCDNTLTGYTLVETKPLPPDIRISSKCKLTSFTKVVNGYMGDVKLAEEEKTKLAGLFQKTLKDSIVVTHNEKSNYELFAIITTEVPVTYMDNNGYPWNIVEGCFFFLNLKEKALYYYKKKTVYVSTPEAAVKVFAREVSLDFLTWMGLKAKTAVPENKQTDKKTQDSQGRNDLSSAPVIIDLLIAKIYSDALSGKILESKPKGLKHDTLVVFNNGKVITLQEFISIYEKGKSNDGAGYDYSLSVTDYLTLYMNFKMKIYEAISQDFNHTASYKNGINEYVSQIAAAYDGKVKDVSKSKYDSIIERYRELVAEYQMGLLLFDITDEKVWVPAVKDEAGRKAFYEKNRSDYKGYSDDEKKITSDYQNYLEQKWLERLREKYQPVTNKKALASFIDSKTSIKDDNKLLDEAYERSKYDIRASHIFIKLDSNATAKDTLNAYNKLLALRERAMNGESFGTLAIQFSEDPSAKDREATQQKPFRKGNQGDLGYFTVFDMVYPFETAAYSTDVGKISLPFRTIYGYHIVKVTEKHDALGKIKVAHLFLKIPPNASAGDSLSVKNKAISLYDQLKNGKSWENLVTQYSDDKSSAKKDGLLSAFKVNRMVPEFIEAIYPLHNPGDYSNPVLTDYGWHIIKIVSRAGIPSFDTAKPELIDKILKDDRGKQLSYGQFSFSQINGLLNDIRDGKTYKTVKIGSQTWMAENLAYESKSDCWAYDNNLGNVPKCGFLYAYEAADSVCPSGWHLPKNVEWSALISYLGGESVAGGKMKETGTGNWLIPNTGADNSSGFFGLPCGLRDITGTFSGKGDSGVWWSSTEDSNCEKHFFLGLIYNSSSIIKKGMVNSVGFSVRCVKDDNTP